MSWKVYDGLRIEGIETIQDAQDFVESLRKPITEILHERIASQIKQMACLIYDMQTFDVDLFDDQEKDRKPLLTATMRIIMDKRQEEDTTYSIGIATGHGEVVAIPFFLNNSECNKFIRELPHVSEFGYWDNADPDEDVSKKEWRLRRRVWSEVFKQHPTPTHAMMITTLVDAKHMIPADEHMQDTPTLQEREEACINHMAMTEASGDWTSEKGLSAFLTAVESIKPDIVAKVEGKLQKTLTIKDLEKELPKKENNNESEGISDTGGED